MKQLKFITIAFAVFSVLCFFSCKKDGVYNPKGKISRIFYESTYSTKRLTQTWTWDKNRLTRITTGSNNFQDFIYDGNRLTTIRYSDGDRMDFTYDGNKLSKMEGFNDGQLMFQYTFEHDGNKIVKMSATSFSTAASPAQKAKRQNTLDFLFGNTVSKNLIDMEKNRATAKSRKAYDVYTFLFEWENNNIKKVTYEETENGVFYTCAYEYEYDKKLNPFYGSLHNLWTREGPQSKNNITRAVFTDADEYEEYIYTYTYDGNFPTEERYYEDNYYSCNSYEYVQ